MSILNIYGFFSERPTRLKNAVTSSEDSKSSLSSSGSSLKTFSLSSSTGYYPSLGLTAELFRTLVWLVFTSLSATIQGFSSTLSTFPLVSTRFLSGVPTGLLKASLSINPMKLELIFFLFFSICLSLRIFSICLNEMGFKY